MTDRIRERYEGQFLDALDLPEGKLVPVEIEAVAEPYTEKDARGKPIDLAILKFKGKTKRLILGKTSYKNIKCMFGSGYRNWIGKTVTIQRRYLTADRAFGVQNTMCIRIMPPVGTPILTSAARYMGSPTPYDADGKPLPASSAKPPPPERDHQGKSAPPLKHPDLDAWLQAVAKLASVAECSEFHKDVLPDCPAEIAKQVEQRLIEHMKTLPEQAT